MIVLKGIYGLEVLPCGCNVRHYKGGKVVTIACKNHVNSVTYICPVNSCKMVFKGKNGLKKHRWIHAI